MSSLHLRATVLVVALLPVAGHAAPLTLDQAVAVSLERSEITRSGRASLRSAEEMSLFAAELPDPVLRVAVEDLPVTGADRFRTARDSMTTKRVELMQEWVSTNKRAARRAAADAAVDRESVTILTARASTRLQTTLAYLDAFYAGKVLELYTLTEQHAREEVTLARARLASAGAGSQEALALTGALGTAEDDSAELRQQQSAAHVALERWVGFHSDELVPTGAFPIPNEPSYVMRHPLVMAARRDTDVAERAATVAATNRDPNWTWQAGYAQRTGYSDLITVGVSIPLPIARMQRQDRETAAKLALVEKADADFSEATRAATAEYRSLLSSRDRLEARVVRYQEGVVKIAQQRITAATAAYRSNQATLVVLFEARHAEVEARRKLLLLQRDLAKTEAELALRPLPEEAAR